VIDIEDPVNPTLLGTYDTPGYPSSVTISGDYAFVADGNSGLQIIDITDVTTPTLLGSYDTPGDARSVTVAGDCAFVADGGWGLQVIDISNPATPTLLGTYDTPDYAMGVTVAGDYAFVADDEFEFLVIDISDPTSPTLFGTYSTPGWAKDVTVSGDYAFVADGPSGLQVIQVFQREINLDDNVGQSLFVDGSNDSIFRARLTAAQSDSIDWELSSDGGVSWQGISPGASWNKMTVPGTDLVWRSTLSLVNPANNPLVTELEIEWLGAAAAVDKIIDVPGDQGGWVEAHFTRSGLDFSDEATLPISNYGIWRRVDSAALIAALNSASLAPHEKNVTCDNSYVGGIPVVTYKGNSFVLSQQGLAASSFPPGTWVWVATVPAVQQDTYIAAVPTSADSSASGTNHTVFVLTAHTTTPSIWYVSESDSGYSLDNIAPAVPEGFAVAYNTGSGNQLSWDPCQDEDFQYFNIYRSNDPNFIPSPSDLVHSATGTSWADPEYDGWNVYYRITALDFVENESDPASPGTATAIAEPIIPKTFALHQNVPNPFNPTTSISYDVPVGGGQVTLQIYDVAGRIVRTLVDREETAGEKRLTWYGRNDQGNRVASGVYFYRMTSLGFDMTRKMILLQ
jgi:hypothetical protein